MGVIDIPDRRTISISKICVFGMPFTLYGINEFQIINF